MFSQYAMNYPMSAISDNESEILTNLKKTIPHMSVAELADTMSYLISRQILLKKNHGLCETIALQFGKLSSSMTIFQLKEILRRLVFLNDFGDSEINRKYCTVILFSRLMDNLAVNETWGDINLPNNIMNIFWLLNQWNIKWKSLHSISNLEKVLINTLRFSINRLDENDTIMLGESLIGMEITPEVYNNPHYQEIKTAVDLKMKQFLSPLPSHIPAIAHPEFIRLLNHLSLSQFLISDRDFLKKLLPLIIQRFSFLTRFMDYNQMMNAFAAIMSINEINDAAFRPHKEYLINGIFLNYLSQSVKNSNFIDIANLTELLAEKNIYWSDLSLNFRMMITISLRSIFHDKELDSIEINPLEISAKKSGRETIFNSGKECFRHNQFLLYPGSIVPN
jgi:hypothetical protein